MPPNPAVENVLATIGTVFWAAQCLPQIWKSWREKSTKGLSEWLIFIWAIASFVKGVYALIQGLNIPLTLQTHLFGFLCLVSWGQCQYYGRNRTKLVSFLMVLGVTIISAAVELVLVFTIRLIHDPERKKVASLFFGILGCILVSVAVVPQYYEIYKLKAVKGISLLFLAVDITGCVFNNLSLAFAVKFDVLAGVSYSLIILLDGIIIVIAWVFKFNDWRRKRRQRRGGLWNPWNHDASNNNDELPQQPDGGGGGEVPLEQTNHKLSETPTRFPWITTIDNADGVQAASADCTQGLEDDGEKYHKGEDVKKVEVKAEVEVV